MGEHSEYAEYVKNKVKLTRAKYVHEAQKIEQ